MGEKTVALLAALLSAAVGVASMIPGVLLLRRERRLVREGKRATATVLRTEDEGNSVEVEFVTEGGRTRLAWLRPSMLSVLRVGESLEVLYDPRDVSSVVPASPADRALSPAVFFTFFGALFVIAAMAVLLVLLLACLGFEGKVIWF